MNYSKRMKLIRERGELSLEELSDKLGVDAGLVKQIESGEVIPDSDYIDEFCEIYHQTHDMLVTDESEASDFDDLIIVGGSRKAIYDNYRCVYLTPKIFDFILLSECGYHIGIIKDEDKVVVGRSRTLDDLGEICYSAVIDNYGNINSYENIRFGYTTAEVITGGHNRFYEGVTVAKDTSDGLIYLVNYKGEKLSDGYGIIDNGIGGGLYMALNYFVDGNGKKYLARKVLLDSAGIEIYDLDFDQKEYYGEDEDDFKLVMSKLSDIDVLVEKIEKYGAGLVEVAPSNIFFISENYCRIMEAVMKFEINHNKKRGSQFAVIMDYLENCIEEYSPKKNMKSFGMPIPKRYFHTGNLLEDINLNHLKSRLEEMLRVLGFGTNF